MTEPGRLATIRSNGFAACEAGYRLSDNPHRKAGNPEAAAWAAGWRDCQKHYE